MPSLLPTPEPADPVEGQPGHFEHSNWLKASVKALDSGVVHKADTWNDTGTANPAFVPSKTASGYPYAKPSDPIVDWPATSQSLAQKLETTLTTTTQEYSAGVIGGWGAKVASVQRAGKSRLLRVLANAVAIDLQGPGVFNILVLNAEDIPTAPIEFMGMVYGAASSPPKPLLCSVNLDGYVGIFTPVSPTENFENLRITLSYLVA